MTSQEKVAYAKLEKITIIKPCLFADIMSGDNESRKKLNEIIEKVNLIMDILNDQVAIPSEHKP